MFFFNWCLEDPNIKSPGKQITLPITSLASIIPVGSWVVIYKLLKVMVYADSSWIGVYQLLLILLTNVVPTSCWISLPLDETADCIVCILWIPKKWYTSWKTHDQTFFPWLQYSSNWTPQWEQTLLTSAWATVVTSWIGMA